MFFSKTTKNLFKVIFLLIPFCLLMGSFRETRSECIYLNYNENAEGPFPRVMEAMQSSLKESRKYPDDAIIEFTQELADYHSVSSNQVLVDSGLSSIIYVLSKTFLGNQKKVIMAKPTFELLADFAKKLGSEVVEVDLKKDYSHDLDAILEQIDSSTALVYICNPNNPTGTLTLRQAIEEFLNKLPPHVYVFIDEAYHHFTSEASEYASFIDHPIDNPRLIVGRTFSKIYGLAGMRLGYAISSPEVISKMKKQSLSFSMNIAVLKGASIVLKSENELQKRIKKLTNERQNFYKQAQARNVSFIPSYGNFVMVETSPYSVKTVIEHFKSHDIIIGREFPSMNQHVRISLGSPDDMCRFWIVWDLLFKQKANE